MNVTIDLQHRETVATVTGDVDADNCADLGAVLLDAWAEDCRLVIDVTGLTFLDSSGISELLRVNQMLAERGQALVLRDPPPPIRRVLEITGLLGHFGLA